VTGRSFLEIIISVTDHPVTRSPGPIPIGWSTALQSLNRPYRVAHSFVSALTCYRVHRGVGIAATLGAALVAVSTLYTRQHYILDVIAGILLASVSYLLFLRSYPRADIPELDRRLAPVLAAGSVVTIGLGVVCFWVMHQLPR
jgi:hypothetical protein